MDSTNTLPQIDSSQSQKEVLANALFAAASPSMLYACDPSTSGGLVWGWLGGRYNSTLIAGGTQTLTASTTTYMVADRTTGAVSFSTATTNWNDSDGYLRVYKIVVGTATVTSYEDHRSATGASASVDWGDIGGTLADQTDLQDALDAKVDAADVGAANGVASLDSSGKVPSAQLPSYVDDVLEYANFAALPGTGETGKIYVTLDDNAQHRWSGSAYVELTASPGTTDAVPEGSTNLYFTEGRVRSTPLTGLSTATNAVITASDTVLQGMGKLQAQISAGGGGGLTNFTESESTASPNDAVPVDALTPSNAGTNVDAAFRPKGNGALLASIPDSSTTGGNKRGTYAVDLQLSRTSADQVASSTYSGVLSGRNNKASNDSAVVAGGRGNLASGQFSAIVGGSGNTASGTYSSAIGANHTVTGQGALALGGECTADADWSVAMGLYAQTRSIKGSLAYSNGAAVNEAGNTRLHLFGNFSDATPTYITGGSSAKWVVQDDSTAVVKGIVAAKSASNYAGWEFSAVIRKAAGGSATLVGTPTVTQIGASAGASTWALTIEADTGSNALGVKVTGQAATNIRWSALLDGTYAVMN